MEEMKIIKNLVKRFLTKKFREENIDVNEFIGNLSNKVADEFFMKGYNPMKFQEEILNECKNAYEN